MSRPTIALAMIVKNEAHNLPVLFESFKGCFDKVYITDTGSTDNTVEVAKELGAEVRHFTWVNDFAAARNASIQDIKEDFVMWMDGDDCLQNPDGFKLWRDEVMNTADFWLGAYHYASDEEGNPTCTFARERVFRNNGKFRFRYFVHEGLVPEAGFSPRAAYVQTWAVRHRRTAEDLKKDRGRNLKLFEANQDKLDSRMKYYYGKEFYENADAVSAVRWLKEALAAPDLEPHDRLVATQYCVYALIQCNQLEQAIGVGLTGTQIFPHRAELWVSVGDCFIKQGKIHEALPFFAAAKHCPFQDAGKTNMAQAVFHAKEAYTFYPRNQIARIFANTGNFEAAVKELEECLKLFPNPESETMLAEVKKIIEIRPGSNVVKKKVDDIVISGTPGGPYEWDGEIYRKKGIGGSETAAVEMAEWLAKLSSRRVIVFNNRSVSKTVNGVDYLPFSEAPKYFGEFEPYFHVAWRHNFKLTDAPTYLWNHDLITPGGENTHWLKTMVLSDFHKSFLMTIQGVKEAGVRITRNGVKPERFDGLKRDKKPIVVWRSSPDRGLDRAIRVMDEVRKTMPELELRVYYGFDNMYKNNAGRQADELKKMIHARPWINFRGNIEQRTLSEECAQAMVWLYPTDFAETYCIGAIESLCEGVYPVVRKFGALKDTLAQAEKDGMATVLDRDCVTEEDVQAWAKEVISAIQEKKWERVSVDPNIYSWKGVAEQWLGWFEEEHGALKLLKSG